MREIEAVLRKQKEAWIRQRAQCGNETGNAGNRQNFTTISQLAPPLPELFTFCWNPPSHRHLLPLSLGLKSKATRGCRYWDLEQKSNCWRDSVDQRLSVEISSICRILLKIKGRLCYIVKLCVTLRKDMGQWSSRKTPKPTTTTEPPTTPATTAMTMTPTTVAQTSCVKYFAVGSVSFVVLVLVLVVSLYFIHKKRQRLGKDPATSQRARIKEGENSERPIEGFENATITEREEGIECAAIQKPQAPGTKDTDLEHPKANSVNASSVIYGKLDFGVECQSTPVHHPEHPSEYASVMFK
ncbi:uncharacterized protein LOC144605537 [Rhinoraja longicauda]